MNLPLGSRNLQAAKSNNFFFLTVGGFGDLLLFIFSVGTAGDVLELLPVVFVTVASRSPAHGGRQTSSELHLMAQFKHHLHRIQLHADVIY